MGFDLVVLDPHHCLMFYSSMSSMVLPAPGIMG